jgi:hypothetical protein
MIIYLGINENNTLPVEVIDFTQQLLSNSKEKILMIQKTVEIKNKDIVKFINLRFLQNPRNNKNVKLLKVNHSESHLVCCILRRKSGEIFY